MSPKDALGWGLMGFLAVLLIFGTFYMTASLIKPPTFAEGYCKALNGESIDSSTCNVDGRVVPVPSWR
jgi:hypothetical protein